MAIKWTFRKTFDAHFYWMKIDDSISPPLTESNRMFVSLRDAIDDAGRNGLIPNDTICFGASVLDVRLIG